MKIRIKIHPHSSREKIIKTNEREFEIWIKEPAEKNKANIGLIKFLKKCFKKDVKLVSGFKSKNKVVEIAES